MKARDPNINRLRQFLDAPNIVPNLGELLDPQFGPKPRKPRESPKIPEIPLPPDFQMRPFPRAVPPLPPGIYPDILPGLKPYIPQRPPSAPDLAPPAVPGHPLTVGSVEPSTRPPASDAPHWLAQSILSMYWASRSPSSPSASDTPSWLDPGPVGKALRRVLGFPE